MSPKKKNYLIYTNTNNPQSAILFGKNLTLSNSTDIILGDLFNEILGGSFMSRLNVSLREKKRLFIWIWIKYSMEYQSTFINRRRISKLNKNQRINI